MSGESVAQVLSGMTPQNLSSTPTASAQKAPTGAGAQPHAVIPSAANSPTATSAPSKDPSAALLDYLLGGSN